MVEQWLLQLAQWLDGFHDWQIYLAIASITFLENIFPPFPGDLLLILSAVYVRQGRIEFLPAYLWSVLGGVLGYTLFFVIVRYFAHLLEHPFFQKIFPPTDRDKVHESFRKYGGWLIAVNRFFTGVRALIAVVAAVAEYRTLPFILLTTVSTLAYNYLLFMFGYAVGASAGSIHDVLAQSNGIMRKFGIIPTAFAVLLVLAGIVYFIRIHRKSRDDTK